MGYTKSPTLTLTAPSVGQGFLLPTVAAQIRWPSGAKNAPSAAQKESRKNASGNKRYGVVSSRAISFATNAKSRGSAARRSENDAEGFKNSSNARQVSHAGGTSPHQGWPAKISGRPSGHSGGGAASALLEEGFHLS